MSPEPELRLLLSRDQIGTAVERLAAEVSRDYRDRNPVLVGVLKGSFVFVADLARRLDFPLEVEFVRMASYGAGRVTSGTVRLVQGLRCPVKGRDVLVVEDIVDSGRSLAVLTAYLRRRRPASLRLCALLDKRARRELPVDIDYLGFSVPDLFLVGYGLDCAERYRNLPDICILD